MSVFELSPEWSDDRPLIDFEHPYNAGNNWSQLLEIEEGRACLSTYKPLSFAVPDPRALDWHAYPNPGTLGIFSKAIIRLIGRDHLTDFALLPVHLNEAVFFLPWPRWFRDCLDREKSDLIMFPSNPHRIMGAPKLAFKKGDVPDSWVFCDRSLHSILLATSIIAERLLAAKPAGLSIKEAVSFP